LFFLKLRSVKHSLYKWDRKDRNHDGRLDVRAGNEKEKFKAKKINGNFG
jgi:hypothetical protein